MRRAVRERFRTGRHYGLTMEPRGVMAQWDDAEGKLTIHGAAKVPHYNRDAIAAMPPGSPEQRFARINLADRAAVERLAHGRVVRPEGHRRPQGQPQRPLPRNREPVVGRLRQPSERLSKFDEYSSSVLHVEQVTRLVLSDLGHAQLRQQGRRQDGPLRLVSREGRNKGGGGGGRNSLTFCTPEYVQYRLCHTRTSRRRHGGKR